MAQTNNQNRSRSITPSRSRTTTPQRGNYSSLFGKDSKKDSTSSQNLPSWEDTEEGRKYMKEFEAKKKAREEEQKMLDKMSYFEQQRYLRKKKEQESSNKPKDGNEDSGTNYNSGDF